jgi:hypothetical protein
MKEVRRGVFPVLLLSKGRCGQETVIPKEVRLVGDEFGCIDDDNEDDDGHDENI